MPVTTPLGLLLSLQLAVAPPAPPPPPPTPSAPPAETTPSVEPAAASDLAAEAPVGEWTPEGGASAHKSTEDPHVVNKKIRRAAKTTIAGGSIAILGVAAALTGGIMYAVSSSQFKKLQDDDDGLMPGDPKRQRNLMMLRVSPPVIYAGAGLALVGVITAIVAGRRFKRLREDKRTTVAFTPVPMLRGGGMAAEVRF
jgi:hypothetical protein